MTNETYKYLKEKVEQAEKIQKMIDEINRFIRELDNYNDNKRMTLRISKRGYLGLIVGDYNQAIDDTLVCQYFCTPLKEAALKLKEYLEQEYASL